MATFAGPKPWVTDHTNWKPARIKHPDGGHQTILVTSNAAAFKLKREMD